MARKIIERRLKLSGVRTAVVGLLVTGVVTVPVATARAAAPSATPTSATPAIDTSTFVPTQAYANLNVPAGARADLTVHCPAGSTPISGGFAVEQNVYRFQDYVNYGDGAAVEMAFENRNSTTQVASVSARCVETHWFHSTGRVVTTFAENNTTKLAGGYTACPTGSIALSARVDWNNTTDQQSVDYSGPTADLKGWYVTGTNHGTSNYMFVDLQCVAATDLPGVFLAQDAEKNTQNHSVEYASGTCPRGMTVLNGGAYTLGTDGSVQPGTFVGTTIQSWPSNTQLYAWVTEAALPYNDTLVATAWCVPNQPPVLTISSFPPSPTADATAQYGFTATDPASTGGYTLSYECAADNDQPTPCTSPWSRTVSGDGVHTFRVTATTSDGRSATTIRQWVYDSTAPTSTMTAPDAPFSLTSPVTLAWNSSDAGSGVLFSNARYQQASDTGGFGKWQYPADWTNIRSSDPTSVSITATLTAGTTQCYSAQAVDNAGNEAKYPAPKCTAMPVDDAALTPSSGWTRASNAIYWNGTSITTSAQNATLTLAGVHLDRAGIVADTCPTCGRVAVFVGAIQVGTINLSSTTTQHQVVLTVPKFAATAGDVTIKVLTNHKPVTIDGLAVSQH